MIEIKDKRLCTGCAACINACPVHVIDMVEDIEGFIYPKVNIKDCIDCHLCEKSCPMLKGREVLCETHEDYPLYYAGQLKNKEDLFEVSSGGAFWAFAQAVIEKGGVVYGAIQENVDHVFHIRASRLEEIKLIRRSKYFQSDIGLSYQHAKEDLKNGLMVLFSGTGCQIAGLKAYLNKDFGNLFTCDVVCHGVPSRKVWNKYRLEKEEKEGKRIVNLVFRDKSFGWSKNHYKITYDDGTIEKEFSDKQLFHAGYLSGLFYRPSCGDCHFASLPRVSDITLADFWKYEGRFRQPEKDYGVSLITVNNDKGNSLLQLSSKYFDFDSTDEDLALSSCKHLDEHPSENPYRAAFFKKFDESGYYSTAEKFITKTNDISILKRIVRKIQRIVKMKR